MDIKELYKKSLLIKNSIETVLEEIGYCKNLCQANVSYNEENPDECMLFDELYSICTHFDYINVVLNYLQLPIKEEGRLQSDGHKKYFVNQTELKCGDVVEILLMDLNTYTFRWNILRYQNHNYDRYINEPARIRAINMKKKIF